MHETPLPQLGPDAGFWRRLLASIVDAFIYVPLVVACIAIYALLIQSVQGNLTFYYNFYAGSLIFNLPAGWLYGALFLSSRWQATPGMKLLHIKVVDYEGRPITFGVASARYLGYLISTFFPLGLGFLMIAFTKRKQGIQDFMAHTYVVVNTHASAPDHPRAHGVQRATKVA